MDGPVITPTGQQPAPTGVIGLGPLDSSVFTRCTEPPPYKTELDPGLVPVPLNQATHSFQGKGKSVVMPPNGPGPTFFSAEALFPQCPPSSRLSKFLQKN